MTDLDTAGLEARLKIVEDKLAIYELIASHPPSADTGSADYTSSVYLEDGVFDPGPHSTARLELKILPLSLSVPRRGSAVRDPASPTRMWQGSDLRRPADLILDAVASAGLRLCARRRAVPAAPGRNGACTPVAGQSSKNEKSDGPAKRSSP